VAAAAVAAAAASVRRAVGACYRPGILLCRWTAGVPHPEEGRE